MLGVVVLLACLLEVADLVARHIAEDSVATHAREETNAASATASITGWPFTYEVLVRHSLPEVTVNLTDVPVGSLHVQQSTADLTDVQLDLSAALSTQSVRVTSVSRAVVTAVVTADELSTASGHAIRLQGNGVVMASAGGREVAAVVRVLSGHILSVQSGGSSLLRVDLSSNPFVRGCTMSLAVLAGEVRASCAMAPVPHSLIAAVSGTN